MTTIVVGACARTTQDSLDGFFQCRGNDNLVRIAVPEKYAVSNYEHASDFWIHIARVPDGRILAVHRVLKHIEFLSSDELLDKGISIQEMLL